MFTNTPPREAAGKPLAPIVGTVKWFNDAKGFGFLRTDSVQGDIFAHYSAIHTDGFKTLKEGQKVQFDLYTGPKGPQAFNIEVVS